jgi:hypothetical protein
MALVIGWGSLTRIQLLIKMNEQNANLLTEKSNLSFVCNINHNFLLLHNNQGELTKHPNLAHAYHSRHNDIVMSQC